jgi:hypothetical protein
LRSQGRLGVNRTPKTDLDDIKLNKGVGGYAKIYN